MDHQKRSLKSQFKLADKLGAACVAVLGPDELDAGEVTLRDMATHTEANAPERSRRRARSRDFVGTFSFCFLASKRELSMRRCVDSFSCFFWV